MATWPKIKAPPLNEDLLLEPCSTEEQLEADWNLLREGQLEAPEDLPRMSRDDLKAFVQGVLQNSIFTTDHIKTRPEWSCACEGSRFGGHKPPADVCPRCEHAFERRDVPDIEWGLVFVPLAFGVLADWTKEQLDKVGCLWAYNREALPRGVNGYPMFMNMRLMHREDWLKAEKVIRRESRRLNEIDMGEDE